MTGSLIASLPGILEDARAEAAAALEDARRAPTPARLAERVLAGGSAPDGERARVARLIRGDNLPALAALAAERERGGCAPLDLAYLDPPYDSGADYAAEAVVAGERRRRAAYSDRWEDGTEGYLRMLAPRLILIRELLAETGSIAVHVDWHAGHLVRLVLDEVFGRERFVNELIWRYGKMHAASRRFPRSHDSVFVYAAGPRHFFAPVRVAPSEYRARFARWLDGEVLRFGAVAASTDRLILLRARRRARELGRPLEADDVLFDFEVERKVQDDVFVDIPIVKGNSRENLAFDTQKPERLLERILSAFCPPGGLVLDPFCGSGTTLAVAERTGRGWIGMDASPVAIGTSRARLIRQGSGAFQLEDAARAVAEPERAVADCALERSDSGSRVRLRSARWEGDEAPTALEEIASWDLGVREPDGGVATFAHAVRPAAGRGVAARVPEALELAAALSPGPLVLRVEHLDGRVSLAEPPISPGARRG